MSGPVSVHTWITAGVELAAGVAAAVALRVVLRRLARRAQLTRSGADDLIVMLLQMLLPWLAVICGIWAAVLTLPLTSGWQNDADHLLVALTVGAITVTTMRLAAAGVRAGTAAHSGISGSATIFVNITQAVVLAVGFLILLNSVGVSITPLLTALGVGGVAVALALQDTLTNLFAGVHILASRTIQAGDFVELDGGQMGYVIDTNWRNTTIHQLPNNLIIVPNATLASSIMTNYHRPEREFSVPVQVRVAYDSDLDHVERVTLEVAHDVMHTVEGGVPDSEPSVRYQTFGDSSIGFSVSLRSAGIASQGVIVHEFIKRLHRRYQLEGIDIPYPVLTLASAPGPDADESPGGPAAAREVPARAG